MSKLLDRVREVVRIYHYSIRTEEAYVRWIREFIRFHGMRHPQEMGEAEVNAFLTALAVERRVAASTQNQARSAILFLYREPWGGRWETSATWPSPGGRSACRWC
jgi:hypothetical protein